MNQQNMTKSKMLICWGLIVVGTILLLTQSGKSMPLLVGAALLFVGLLLSKGHLPAVVVLLAGIAAAALSLFFNTDYMDYTQLICGVLLALLGLSEFFPLIFLLQIPHSSCIYHIANVMG